VSITPLQLDLTDHEALATASKRVHLDEPVLADQRPSAVKTGDGAVSETAAEEEVAESEASAG
jgi:hypothetical protein